MLRWLIKKGIFCILLLGLVYYLNGKNPRWIQDVGRWVGDSVGRRVSVTVSSLLDRAEEHFDLSRMVEVFREEP